MAKGKPNWIVRQEEQNQAMLKRIRLRQKMQKKIDKLEQEVKNLKTLNKELNSELNSLVKLYSNCHCDEDGRCQYMSEEDD